MREALPGSPEDTPLRRSRNVHLRKVKAWVNAMQEVMSEQSRYVEGRDLPNIPFNTDSPDVQCMAIKAIRGLWIPSARAGADPAQSLSAVATGAVAAAHRRLEIIPLALTMEDLIAA